MEYAEYIHFFNPVACSFLYKAKDLSASSPLYRELEINGSLFSWKLTSWKRVLEKLLNLSNTN
jgi:hypothetical protein